MSHSSNDLDVATALADAARALLQKSFADGVEVSYKPDGSPVTPADISCEKLMRGIIASSFPDDAVWGEELGKERDKRMWVLDPIDGTKAFTSGSPLFCTLIGLIVDNHPALGIIEVPALAQRWVGFNGELSLENVPRRKTGTTKLAKASVALTHPGRRMRKVYGQSGVTRFGGDAYNFARVASGQLDIALDECLQPHDFVALLPVIKAGGGCYSDFEGNEPKLGEPSDLICSANEILHEQALALLK